MKLIVENRLIAYKKECSIAILFCIISIWRGTIKNTAHFWNIQTGPDGTVIEMYNSQQSLRKEYTSQLKYIDPIWIVNYVELNCSVLLLKEGTRKSNTYFWQI